MNLDKSQLKKGMGVVAADGRNLGTVESVEGERLSLSDETAADKQFHFVKLVDIASIRGDEIHLKADAVVN